MLNHRPMSCVTHDKMSSANNAQRTKKLLQTDEMESNAETVKKEQAHRLRSAREHVLGPDSTATDGAAYLKANRDTYIQHENGIRSFKNAVITYAQKYGVSPGWLLFGNEPPEWAGKPKGEQKPSTSRKFAPSSPFQSFQFSHNVNVTGVVKAGAWAEMTDGYDEPLSVVPYHDEALRGMILHGYVVKGPSMNKVFPEDGILICTSISDRWPREHDYVIVRNREGRFCEITVKQVEIGPDGQIELWPRSTDPRFQEKLSIPPRNEYQQDGWEIIAVVENCIPPALTHSGRALPNHSHMIDHT